MAGTRFYGPIGYGRDVEGPAGDGVWTKEINEVMYFGEIQRESRRLSDGSQVNNDLSVGNSLSIIADPYATNHYHEMLYIIWNGVYWLVSVAEPIPGSPRMTVRLGGVYNGPKFTKPEPDPDPEPEPPVGLSRTFESTLRD